MFGTPVATGSNEFMFWLGTQFLLDPGEVNGWGILGIYDNSNTQDLGNIGAANLNRIAGGLKFPWDVRIKRFNADHYNSIATALPWGWVLFSQEKNPGSNTVTTTYLLDEVTSNNGVGPRDYGNTTNQETDLILPSTAIVPAGHTLGMGVAAPTAVGTNNYVRILSGYLLMEKV